MNDPVLDSRVIPITETTLHLVLNKAPAGISEPHTYEYTVNQSPDVSLLDRPTVRYR